ncbi:virB8 family protein [Pseudomonas sp. LW8]|uniref:virB8 family protein n=1 Tax=Pseudomonas sp. LW8 TaxID=3242677 RepID=UPI0035BECC92
MKFRLSKQKIIEQEQELAAGLVLDPELARNISLAQAAYTNAAKWFEANVAAEYQKKAKSAKLLSYFFGMLAFMAIGAVMMLTPLKTVEPYVVRVDNATGATDIVRPGGQAKTQKQVDDEYYLSNYVRFREGYNFADSDAMYATVELMSYADAFTEYKNFQMSKKGYTETLGNNRQMKVEIRGVGFLARDEKAGTGTAQVRIIKTVVDRNGVPDPNVKPATWQTTITYDYKNPPKKREQDWINPRGLGIKSYSKVQEAGTNNG